MRLMVVNCKHSLRNESGAYTVQDEKPNQEHKQDERSEEFDRFEETMKKLAKVPKEEVDEERRKWEREKRAG